MHTRVLMLVVSLGLGLGAFATTGPVATSGEQPQVAKASQRAELYALVSRYLTEVAALEPIVLVPSMQFPTRGTLPGWRDRVCPQVSGAPKEDSEFILARVTEIARAVGVRMADEHCSPNLHIFLTTQPNELLQRMRGQDSFAMFGPRGSPHLLDQFSAMPRPVRVWYNIYGAGPSVSFKYAFTGVLVIVDQTQLQGVSRGQLADYIAMVGLAEIKPGANLGDAPTILRLFDGASQPAPAGLSDLDQALLRSLYLNSRAIPWGRELGRSDQLTLRMVSAIVP
jgi:hypothetical protein